MAEVIFTNTAQKSFLKLPKIAQKKIEKGVEKLSQDPLAGEKLRGEFEGQFKLYAWPYRIIYLFDPKSNIVQVVTVGHRQGVYKK